MKPSERDIGPTITGVIDLRDDRRRVVDRGDVGAGRPASRVHGNLRDDQHAAQLCEIDDDTHIEASFRTTTSTPSRRIASSARRSTPSWATTARRARSSSHGDTLGEPHDDGVARMTLGGRHGDPPKASRSIPLFDDASRDARASSRRMRARAAASSRTPSGSCCRRNSSGCSTNKRGPPTTVHPLGGCAMADTAAHGVVDDCGACVLTDDSRRRARRPRRARRLDHSDRARARIPRSRSRRSRCARPRRSRRDGDTTCAGVDRSRRRRRSSDRSFRDEAETDERSRRSRPRSRSSSGSSGPVTVQATQGARRPDTHRRADAALRAEADRRAVAPAAATAAMPVLHVADRSVGARGTRAAFESTTEDVWRSHAKGAGHPAEHSRARARGDRDVQRAAQRAACRCFERQRSKRARRASASAGWAWFRNRGERDIYQAFGPRASRRAGPGVLEALQVAAVALASRARRDPSARVRPHDRRSGAPAESPTLALSGTDRGPQDASRTSGARIRGASSWRSRSTSSRASSNDRRARARARHALSRSHRRAAVPNRAPARWRRRRSRSSRRSSATSLRLLLGIHIWSFRAPDEWTETGNEPRTPARD